MVFLAIHKALLNNQPENGYEFLYLHDTSLKEGALETKAVASKFRIFVEDVGYCTESNSIIAQRSG
jgi:hypothetical protein